MSDIRAYVVLEEVGLDVLVERVLDAAGLGDEFDAPYWEALKAHGEVFDVLSDDVSARKVRVALRVGRRLSPNGSDADVEVPIVAVPTRHWTREHVGEGRTGG